jgi:hypothetical protein
MKDIDGKQEVLRKLEPHWHEIEEDFDKNNQRFLQLADADHNAIGRILKAHLVIENFLNSFLSSHYGIEDIDDLKLSFIQKAKLLPTRQSSAAFVRPGILQLNSIRNKFGHRLNHEIKQHEISAIYEALAVARKEAVFESPITAIEAFAPIACAFLSVQPPHLRKLFAEAFENVHSHTPESSG